MRTLSLLLTWAVVAAAPAWAGPEEALNKAGCMACHAKDKKLVGPSFKDIAAKYKGNAGAVALLTDKVRKGGKGTFGPIPMPPHGADKISDADLKASLDHILAP
jgi:cytochrome c